ncbi:MAG: DUF881 domain-containing protein [Clostridiales bacterium]|nr:DUF881 domain-containing protein [Clostridiales bacterium]
MKKASAMITIGIMALLIGWVLSVQILTTDGSDQGGLVPIIKLKQYEEELKMLRGEKEDALSELVELEDRMKKIESEKTAEDDFLKALVSDLEKYKMASGVLDVQGPGIVITIKDSAKTDEYQDDYNSILYNSEQFLSLINKLKEAGAEAISINEQRIVGTTEISLAGNGININGSATAPPYTVKAVGNPAIIESALTIRGGIIETMKKKYNWIVDITQREEIAIARYTGVVSFKSAKPVPTGDGTNY